ncbi:hypothetical protein HHK36_002086 [Tetracentron sinense]|uniref:peroxidase n=1 Tax=Tetracentron sinense TaxID=13715 RepID=A0A834ZXJ5_TETSI|nr:hypothetical protein HHK36_002086 [Tetracentron sinense]
MTTLDPVEAALVMYLPGCDSTFVPNPLVEVPNPTSRGVVPAAVEHIPSIASPPTRPIQFNSVVLQFLVQRHKPASTDAELYLAHLQTLIEDDIIWRPTWMPRQIQPRLSTVRRTCIILAGLSGSAPYAPLRVLRQLGYAQFIPTWEPMHEDFIDFKGTSERMRREFASSWRLSRWREDENLEYCMTPQTVDGYDQWLILEDQASSMPIPVELPTPARPPRHGTIPIAATTRPWVDTFLHARMSIKAEEKEIAVAKARLAAKERKVKKYVHKVRHEKLIEETVVSFKLITMGSIRYVGIVILVVLGFFGSAQGDLKMGFYAKSCPKAEKIVLDYVKKHIPNAPSLAAAFIRMHFHDCFVRGCDGSVLLNSTSSNQAEKDAVPNQTLRGFDFIDRVKSLLEAECPSIVSCADVLALVARDTVVATGGPFWNVPTGRRDGVISNSSEVLSNIPAPFNNFTTLQTSFANKGLDVKDLVLLSGAHTIGIAHCPSFTNRLYNFTGVGDQDPALDSQYAANLKANKCKTLNDNTTIVEMDPGSFRSFDFSYYTFLLKRRGLFESDAALITDTTSRSFITQLLQGSLKNFFVEFANSIEKMGQIGVKTGSLGEIRKHCAVVNS